MKIFSATEADVPRMMSCARDCCLEHGEEVLGGKLDEDHYATVWKGLLRDGSGVMFLVEREDGEIVGGIGGVASKVLLTGKLRAMQLFWYMRPEYRSGMTAIRLLDRFETWAKEQGCKQITLPIHARMSQSTDKIYTRRGYVSAEVAWRRML